MLQIQFVKEVSVKRIEDSVAHLRATKSLAQPSSPSASASPPPAAASSSSSQSAASSSPISLAGMCQSARWL